MKQGIFGSLSMLTGFGVFLLGMILPKWKQPLGFLCMFLALLGVILAFYGLIQAILTKKKRLINVLLFLFNLIAGSIVTFWGFALTIPS